MATQSQCQPTDLSLRNKFIVSTRGDLGTLWLHQRWQIKKKISKRKKHYAATTTSKTQWLTITNISQLMLHVVKAGQLLCLCSRLWVTFKSVPLSFSRIQVEDTSYLLKYALLVTQGIRITSPMETCSACRRFRSHMTKTQRNEGVTICHQQYNIPYCVLALVVAILLISYLTHLPL